MNVEHIDFEKITAEYQRQIDAIKGYIPRMEKDFLKLKNREEKLTAKEREIMKWHDDQLVNKRQELEAKEMFLQKYKMQVENFNAKYAKELEEMQNHFEEIMEQAAILILREDIHPEFITNLTNQLRHYKPDFTEPERVNYFIAVRFEVQSAQKSKRIIA